MLVAMLTSRTQKSATLEGRLESNKGRNMYSKSVCVERRVPDGWGLGSVHEGENR